MASSPSLWNLSSLFFPVPPHTPHTIIPHPSHSSHFGITSAKGSPAATRALRSRNANWERRAVRSGRCPAGI